MAEIPPNPLHEGIDEDCTVEHAAFSGKALHVGYVGFRILSFPDLADGEYVVVVRNGELFVGDNARQACDYLHAYRLMNGMNEDGTER